MRSEGPRFDFAKNAWVGGSPFPVHASDEPPRPGRWTKPPPPDAPNRLGYAFVGAATLLVMAATYAMGPVYGLIGIALVLFVLREMPKTVARRERKGPLTEADRRLLEDPDDKNVCLVRITVVCDDRPVGSDKGAVWFGEGKLFYSGHRTSFVLGGRDVLPASEWRVFDSGLQGGFWWGETNLPLVVPEGRAYVRFEPLSYGDAREMRFVKRFNAFRQERPPSGGPRQLPPLSNS